MESYQELRGQFAETAAERDRLAAENETLRKRVAELNRAHTLIACDGCGKGVRAGDTRGFRCFDCVAAEVERLRAQAEIDGEAMGQLRKAYGRLSADVVLALGKSPKIARGDGTFESADAVKVAREAAAEVARLKSAIAEALEAMDFSDGHSSETRMTLGCQVLLEALDGMKGAPDVPQD